MADYLPRLGQDGGRAATADPASLVNGDGAEAAITVTAPVGCDGKPDGFQRLYLSLSRIVGMEIPLVCQGVDGVQLFRCEIKRRGILDKETGVLFLGQGTCRERIDIFMKDPEHLREGGFVRGDSCIIRQAEAVCRCAPGDVAEPPDGLGRLSIFQGTGERYDGTFRHPVEEIIPPGVEEDGAPYPVGPGVVVGNPPQAGLYASQYDRGGRVKNPSDEVAVNNHRPVGTAEVPSTGGIVVPPPLSPRGRVIGDHGIDASTGHAPEKGRRAQSADISI